MIDDIEAEIERLKAKKAAISSKLSSTRNFQIKEKLKSNLLNLENQIKILENMKKKSI